MLDLRKNKGITMISLVVMIVVIMIIAGISVYSGTNLIKKIRLEAVQTNMISTRAKAKGIAEEINSGVWTESEENKAAKRRELFEQNYGFIFQADPPKSIVQSPIIANPYECYELSKMAFEKMGLDDIFDGENRYFVVYDESDYTNLDIIYDSGTVYNKVTYYSLAKLQEDISSQELEEVEE